MNKLIRAVASLVALVGILVGIPWLLVRRGDWPITRLPTVEWFKRTMDTAVSDSALFSVLTVAAWLVWALFAFSVLVELGAAVRGFEVPRISLLGPLQGAAHGLVAALLVTLSINHAVSSAAAVPAMSGYPPSMHNAAAVTQPVRLDRSNGVGVARPVVLPFRASNDAARSAAPVRRDGAPNLSAATVTVERGDSPWSIAERHLGDGMRWRELWDLNHDVPQADGRAWTNERKIMVGWVLRLPGSVSVAPPPAAAESGSYSYTVVPGDNLAEIAEDQLGDEARYREIFDLSRGTEQPGGRHLTDPNLILPGWKVTIPGSAKADTPPAAPEPPPTVPTPTAPEVPPATTAPSPPPTTTATSSPVPISAEPAPPTSAPATADRPTATSVATPVTWPAPAAPTVSGHRSDSRSVALLAALGGSIVLASGLSVRMTYLRRRRISRGVRDRMLVETNAANIKTVNRAADVPLVKWAGHGLAALMLKLDRRTVTGAPEAIELSEAAGIEILWDTEQPAAPEPWQAADGGWAWRLAYDEDAPTPAMDDPAPLPALVTIGSRSGRQLLIDLEAFGTIAISGPDDRVDDFLRSIALELVAGDDIADAFVHVVDLDLPGDGFDRLTRSTVEMETARLAATAASVTTALEAANLNGTFQARLGSPVPIEAAVAIIGRPSDDLTHLLTTPIRRGVAVIVAGKHPDARCRIQINEDGTARIEPLGIDFHPSGVSLEAAEAINETLAELHELMLDPPRQSSLDLTDGAPPDSVPVPEDDEVDESSPSASGETSDGSSICLMPPILVKVLGVPSVRERPNMPRRELITTVVLACHGRPIAGSVVQDAIYGDNRIGKKTLWNVMGYARDALGLFDDGTDIFPQFDRVANKMSLDPRVKTDVAVLRESLELARTLSTAEAVAVLTAAHQLIDGQPFDADGYQWAHDDQFVAEASNLIETATTDLVDLAIEAHLIDVARAAIRRGFRALRDNEGLYRCRMKVEHAAGNPGNVRKTYDDLRTYLATVETEPARETADLLRHLFDPGAG